MTVGLFSHHTLQTQNSPDFPAGKSGLSANAKALKLAARASGQLLLLFGGGSGGGGASSGSRSISSRSSSFRGGGSSSVRRGGSHSGAVGGGGSRALGGSRSLGRNGRFFSLLRLARGQTSGEGQAQSSNFEQVVHFEGNFENGLTKKRPLSRLLQKVTRGRKIFFRRVT